MTDVPSLRTRYARGTPEVNYLLRGCHGSAKVEDSAIISNRETAWPGN